MMPMFFAWVVYVIGHEKRQLMSLRKGLRARVFIFQDRFDEIHLRRGRLTVMMGERMDCYD